jgi:predicted DNA-binding transcriptional regulator AlpA
VQDDITVFIFSRGKNLDVSEVPKVEIPAVLGHVEALRARLWSRLQEPPAQTAPAARDSDQLLDVREAAGLLGMSVDWLYTNYRTLPVVIRTGSRSLRFSKNGIQDYIQKKQKGGR